MRMCVYNRYGGEEDDATWSCVARQLVRTNIYINIHALANVSSSVYIYSSTRWSLATMMLQIESADLMDQSFSLAYLCKNRDCFWNPTTNSLMYTHQSESSVKSTIGRGLGKLRELWRTRRALWLSSEIGVSKAHKNYTSMAQSLEI